MGDPDGCCLGVYEAAMIFEFEFVFTLEFAEGVLIFEFAEGVEWWEWMVHSVRPMAFSMVSMSV